MPATLLVSPFTISTTTAAVHELGHELCGSPRRSTIPKPHHGPRRWPYLAALRRHRYRNPRVNEVSPVVPLLTPPMRATQVAWGLQLDESDYRLPIAALLACLRPRFFLAFPGPATGTYGIVRGNAHQQLVELHAERVVQDCLHFKASS
ncbi:hypothetical protein BJV78DRAFT_1281758 [Lactifluus subvellereus]|nr:hypothetical protein BJV78DRAFT_1281758 [Lactifluus subvellereus]